MTPSDEEITGDADLRAAEERLDNAIADAFTSNDPLSIWFAVRVYLTAIIGNEEYAAGLIEDRLLRERIKRERSQ